MSSTNVAGVPTSVNSDSMNEKQGEFKPSAPRDEPMTTKGHKPGVKTSPADHAPEFSAKTLPPGSAPAESTFQPNSTSEVPGQADNEDVLRGHGKESTYTSAESTLGGTTSDAVHTGYGHPGAGQTSTEIRKDGKHTSTRERTGFEGRGAQGGSGLRDDGNQEAHDLASDHTEKGPPTGNVSRLGAEDREPVHDEQLAADPKKLMKHDYPRGGITHTDVHGKGVDHKD